MTYLGNCLLLDQENIIRKKFLICKTPEETYQKIIELGKTLPKFPEEDKVSENLVTGCQSILYLTGELKENLLYFSVYSDALISRGLGALLLKLYNGCTPKEILNTPPVILKELGIPRLLSPSRANGLKSLLHKIQKISLSKII